MPVKHYNILRLLLKHIRFFIKLKQNPYSFSFGFTGYKEYHDPEEMATLYSSWSKEINDACDERIRAISFYAGWRSTEINKFLRGDSSHCYDGDIIETFRQLLASSPRLLKNTVLYRAIPFFVLERVLKEMETTGQCVDNGFLSTSLNLTGISNIEDDLMGKVEYVLKLYVPSGVPALYIEDIKGSGMGRKEYEIILPPGAVIRMNRPPFKEKVFGYWIFECELDYNS